MTVQPVGLIYVRRVWRHEGEGEAIHVVVAANEDERHIKLKRESNAALYDFIAEHAAAIPTSAADAASER